MTLTYVLPLGYGPDGSRSELTLKVPLPDSGEHKLSCLLVLTIVQAIETSEPASSPRIDTSLPLPPLLANCTSLEVSVFVTLHLWPTGLVRVSLIE